MDPRLFALDATLGALAFFSPCGFPMLPAWLAYYLARPGPDAAPGRSGLAPGVARGIVGGLAAAAGAFVVLLAIGGAAALLGSPFKRHVGEIELAGAIIVFAMGALTLARRAPSLALPLRAPRTRSAWALAAFGALYALVAASCVAPLLLAVLVQAFAAPTWVEGALLVCAYAVGLAGMLALATVLAGAAQGALLGRARAAAPRIERASGWVLLAVGAYLFYYWVSVPLGWPRIPSPLG